MEATVVIPTIKSSEELEAQVNDAFKTLKVANNVIVQSAQQSASKNRNDALNAVSTEYVIMMDDDITGFFDGWDEMLLRPLIEIKNAVMTSARLINADGSFAYMLCDGLGERANEADIITVKQRELPTSCIAFKNDGTRFDENFIGSGFEDNDFCLTLGKKYPLGTFHVVNNCRLIHINEKKNQHGANMEIWNANKAYFNKKWNTKR